MNQIGEIQAIGGVNEKSEGFLRVCKAVGLTCRPGVLIPEAHARHLVLHPDVIDAVRRVEFQSYPVRKEDEGMEILSGSPAGDPGQEGTVNGVVDAALEAFDRRSRDRDSDKPQKEETEEEAKNPTEAPIPPRPPEPRQEG